MSEIIKKIKKEFIKEAKESPLLFNDLANLEKYVSESYSGRSLIELLQNADDAGARSFYLKKIDDTRFVVANDGRKFTENDMLSLCRSGASTKTRKSDTIGYRGIGFKSVVNYAENVYLRSGDIATSFSRDLTKKELNNNIDVPLIRIPHEYFDESYSEEVNRLENSGYTTIFIFETKNNMWEQEIKSFDSSCMIFLNNVCKIFFLIDKEQTFSSSKVPFEDGVKVTLDKNNNEDEWYVIKSSNKESKSSIALKISSGKITQAEKQESIAHCFMPTLSQLSMNMKVNGDFSTDPSRTRITIDEDTESAIYDCSQIIRDTMYKILDSKNDKLGFIRLIADGKIDPLSKIRGEDVNDLLCKYIKEYITDYLKEKYDKDVYLQPEGMSKKDFSEIIKHNDVCGIEIELEKKIPDVYRLLKISGVHELPVEMSVNAMKSVECSDSTKAAIVGELIKKDKVGFGIDSSLKEEIKKSNLFSFESGATSIDDAGEDVVLDDEFEGSILDNVSSPQEYDRFMKKIGIKTNNSDNEIEDHSFENVDDIEIKRIENTESNKTIKKWRTVEQNVAEVLSLSDNVVDVIDVSKQNLGYDLEATMDDGSKRYYEIKSVDGFNDSFSITNNEYTTANENKDNYYLAITNMLQNSIEICFIKNPIKKLRFTKRVTRWEWLCEDYSGDMIKIQMKG